MAESPLEIHVIADSTGETAVRLARAARSQFEGVHWHIVRHPMIGTVAEMMAALEAVMAAHEAGQWVCVVHTPGAAGHAPDGRRRLRKWGYVR